MPPLQPYRPGETPLSPEVSHRIAEAAHGLGRMVVESETDSRRELEATLRGCVGATLTATGLFAGFETEKRAARKDPSEIIANATPMALALYAETWMLSDNTAGRPHIVYGEALGSAVRALNMATTSLAIDYDVKRLRRIKAPTLGDQPSAQSSGRLFSSLSAMHSLVEETQVWGRPDVKDMERLALRLEGQPRIGGNPFTRRRRTARHITESIEAANLQPEDVKTAIEAGMEQVGAIRNVHAAAQFAYTLHLESAFNRCNPLLGRDQDLKKLLRASYAVQRELIAGFIKTGAFNADKSDRLLGALANKTQQLMDAGMLRESTEELQLYLNAYNSFRRLQENTWDLAGMMEEVYGPTAIPEKQLGQLGMAGAEANDESSPAPSDSEPEVDPAEAERLAQLRAEQIATLQAAREQTVQDLTALREPYSASMRTLRRQKLNLILHDLQVGYRNELTGKEFGGISGDEAYRVTALLHGLAGEFAASEEPEIAQDRLSSTLRAETTLLESLQELRRQLNAYGINGFSKDSAELNEACSWLDSNHKALTEVLRTKLGGNAQQYIRVLEQLFTHAEEPAAVLADATEVIPPAVPEPAEEDLDLTEVVADEPLPAEPEPETELAPEPETEERPAVDVEEELSDETARAIQLEAINEAIQLDWEMFPPDVTIEDIKHYVSKNFPRAQATKTDWGRVADILQLKRAYGGELYRGKSRSLGTAKNEPYLATVISVENHRFIVAEHPKLGNATYILRADLAEYGATWREVFEQSRQFARLLGAAQLVHDPRRAHLDAILDKIQSLLSVKPQDPAE